MCGRAENKAMVDLLIVSLGSEKIHHDFMIAMLAAV